MRDHIELEFRLDAAGEAGRAFWFIAPPIASLMFFALVTLIAVTTYDTAMMQTNHVTEAAWAHAIIPASHAGFL